jgi:PAS domain S-box-containing protein
MGFPGVLTLIPSTHWLGVVCSFAIADSLTTPIACLFVSVLLPLFPRRQIDQAIAQSEQLFAAFMDNLPGFVWMKDLSGRYVYVNERVKRLAPQQNGWLGKTDGEIWPSEIAATFRENDLKVVASREAQETLEPCRLEGQDLWILVTRFPVFDDTGAVVMVGGAGVDITERKRAEKALRETEEKYRSIFEKAVEGIFQTTPDGRFVAANPALARIFGFDSPAELIGTRTDIAQEHYVDPRRREEFKRSLEENGFVLDFELEAYRKDRSKIWISENVRAVRDHTGTVVYYEGTTQDITGRRHAEEALRESEERYRDLVENSRDLICTHDLNGLILSANRAALELLGHSSGGFAAGTNLRQILSPEVRDQFDDYLTKIRVEGVASGLMLVLTRTGEKRIWEYHNTLRTEGVSAPIVRGMARDITEQRRANQSLKLFRTLIDQSSDAIEVVDPNTMRFLDCNKSAYQDLGYSREEFLSLSVYDIDALVDERRTAQLTKEMDQSGFVIFESVRRRKDGSTFPVEVNLKTVRLERNYRLAVVRDITERKLAEEALRQAQSRIESILNSVADIHVLFDRNWRYLYVNEAAVRAIGQPREQILGRTLWELYPDIADTELDRQYRRAMAERVHVAFEFHYSAPHTWWENRFYPAPEGLAVFATNITERKLAEDALRQAERKYRDIFENAVEGIFQISPGGGYISANLALARMLGFNSPEELISERSDPSNQTFVDLGRRQEYTRLLSEEGFVRDFEYEDYRKDGSRIWLSDNAHAVRDSKGILLYYEGTTQDITARKLVEQALRESEERYRELFENAKDVTYVHDLSGKYTSVNRAAEKLTGYKLSEILGKNFINFVPPEQIDNIRTQLCRKLVEEEETSYESEVITKDGRRIAVEVNSHLIFENGVAVGVQGTARDITERKAAEAKLKATSKQLRALSARLQSAREEEGTRIAREIHDELGSLLTSLKWDLEGIDKNLSTPVGPTGLAALREKLHALMKLTDLAISAIRRIASELRPSVLDDLGLVAAIEWQAQQFQARTGIECDCDCSLEKVELTEEQSTAVFRILQEALTNVLRHAQATRVDIKVSKENDILALSISDNGQGIPESETSDQQSLGILGMRERAHLIAGEIDIKGVEGKGTVVIVRVPISGQARVVKMTR